VTRERAVPATMTSSSPATMAALLFLVVFLVGTGLFVSFSYLECRDRKQLVMIYFAHTRTRPLRLSNDTLPPCM